MKQRLKNWITSIIGLVIMVASVVWKFFPSYIPAPDDYVIEPLSNMEFGTLLFLGWVFLSAKNSLLQGILGNFIKFKNTDDQD